MNRSKRRLLWIDDDGRDRFLLTERILKDDGWEITWALTGVEALESLKAGSEPFDALLVDQMFPLRFSEARDVWAGARVLHWLNGQAQPTEAPEVDSWENATQDLAPNQASAAAFTLVVSAFYDEQVTAALKALNPGLIIMAKPVDRDLLRMRLKTLVLEINS